MNKIKLKQLTYLIRRDYLTVNNVIVIVAIFIAANWAWGSIGSMQKNYELQQLVDTKKQQVEIAELQTNLLEYESKYYSSSEYLDLTIRERMGLGTPGERLLILPSTDELDKEELKPGTPKSTSQSSNFQQWMNFLLGSQP